MQFELQMTTVSHFPEDSIKFEFGNKKKVEI